MLRLLFFIPLLPLAGAAINGLLGGFFGRRWKFSERVAALIACGTTGLSALLAIGAIIDYARNHASGIYIDAHYSWTWIAGGPGKITLGEMAGQVRDFRIDWAYQLDPLSAVMLFIVTFVGFLIHVFAVGYMKGEDGYYRFFAYLNLFMFMMLVLVLGSNFVMMFVGWEGVGLCSYLLIGFYTNRGEAGDAAKKAFITNRVGDMGFMLGMFGVFALFGTLQFSELSAMFAGGAAAPYVESLGQWGVMSWIALGLFIGATGKSAQIPLSVWLPDAMAGPTPVSALIHAATMVTAGVYLLARTSYIFQAAPSVMMIVAVVGALTAIFGATIALTQNDIKKVLAYSTVSQLGLMFLACGVGAFTAAIFHVFTHAFFKAQLFLGSGSVIHAMHHEQDIRKMGGLKKYMPKTYWTMTAAWLAICGVIPFAGFFSKDEILWQTFNRSTVLYLAGLLVSFCTAFYMTRMMVMTFEGSRHQNDSDEHHHEPHESPAVMWIPLAVLAVLSIIGGWVGIPHALGGRNYFAEWLEPVTGAAGEAAHASIGLELGLMGVSLLVAVAGILLARWIYLKRPDVAESAAHAIGGAPYRLSLNKYFVDEGYAVFPIGALLRLSKGLMSFDARGVDGVPNGSARLAHVLSRGSEWFDKYVIDLAVNLQGWMVRAGSVVLRSAQTGLVQNYALLMVLGLIAFFAVYLLAGG
ncbi:MAG: NADH-quinone oxidoreductase subunit L [Blastocatellales bacterium]|nr:NADH-quinone oxidoreductase subunit L [Blastocatellales bacterium]